MENHSINQRIIDVIKFLDTTPTVFADEIGIQRSGLSHIIKGRNRPSLDVIQKIVARYPDISLGWLVNGTGNISSTTPSVINLQQKRQPSSPPSADPVKSPEKSLKNTLFDTPREDETPDSPLDAPSSGTVYSPSRGASAEGASAARRIFTPQDFELSENVPPQASAATTAAPNTVSRTAEGRKIAKILVFYTDNTFEEFLK